MNDFGNSNQNTPPPADLGFPHQQPGGYPQQSFQPLPDPDLTVGVCFAGGWHFFKNKLGEVYGMMLVIVLFSFASSLLATLLGGDDQQSLHAVGVQLGVSFLFIPLQIGPTIYLARVGRGEDIDATVIFSGYKRFFGMIGVAFLTAFVILGGFILLIIPGIILSIGLYYSQIVFLDRGYGVVASLRTTWDMMNGYKWSYFVLSFGLVFLNILGILALFVGLFVTIPLSVCIWIYFYNAVSEARLGPARVQPGEVLQS